MISGRGGDDAVGTDMVSQIQTRMSMEARRSFGHGHRPSGDREGLIRAYDEEEAAEFGLTDLTEDSDDQDSGRRGGRGQNGSAQTNGKAHRKSSSEMQAPKASER